MSMSVALSIKEQKRKRNKAFLLIFSVLVLIFLTLALFSFFIFNSKKNIIADELKQNAIFITKNINENIEADFHILKILANLVAENPELSSIENLDSLLSNSQSLQTFNNVSYIYKNGSGYDYDSNSRNLTLNDYSKNKVFIFAIGGQTCFYYDFEIDKFIYAIPVNDSKNNIVGVVLATQNTDKIATLLKYNDPEKKYLTYLINGEGNFILKDPSSSVDVKSLFDPKFTYFSRAINKSFYNLRLGSSIVKWTNNKVIGNNLLVLTKIEYDAYRVLTVLPNANINFQNNIIKFNKKLIVFSGLIFLLVLFLIAVAVKCRKIYKNKSGNMVMKWALYDEITDGYNKPKFYLEVSNTFLNAKEDDKYAMILIDINNFKIINQLYDSIKGNNVLKDISDSIKWFLEKDGISARIMSDNFAVLYKYKREEKIITFINNLIRALSEYKLSVKLVPSFGIYKINDFNLPIDTMIDRALMAKKTIKDEIDTHYAFFTDELIDKIIAAKEIENEMYYALNQKQFTFYLQPVFDTLTKDIIGAEALVRWVHPEKGLLLPAKFLDVFEKNGFITYLDQYILEEVCKLQRKWIDNGVTPYPISINISGLHLNNPRFVAMVKSMLDMYKIPYKYINFEISEISVFDSLNFVKRTTAELRESGFKLTIDNFGKNYSAITLLNDISPDFIKFDKEFVSKLILTDKGKTILKESNNLVKSLYINTVAVGIEDENVLNCLKTVESDGIQGFICARPMPIIDFENLVFKKTIGSEELDDKSLDI